MLVDYAQSKTSHLSCNLSIFLTCIMIVNVRVAIDSQRISGARLEGELTHGHGGPSIFFTVGQNLPPERNRPAEKQCVQCILRFQPMASKYMMFRLGSRHGKIQRFHQTRTNNTTGRLRSKCCFAGALVCSLLFEVLVFVSVYAYFPLFDVFTELKIKQDTRGKRLWSWHWNLLAFVSL